MQGNFESVEFVHTVHLHVSWFGALLIQTNSVLAYLSDTVACSLSTRQLSLITVIGQIVHGARRRDL